jgi:hypothetical protein
VEKPPVFAKIKRFLRQPGLLHFLVDIPRGFNGYLFDSLRFLHRCFTLVCILVFGLLNKNQQPAICLYETGIRQQKSSPHPL